MCVPPEVPGDAKPPLHISEVTFGEADFAQGCGIP